MRTIEREQASSLLLVGADTLARRALTSLLESRLGAKVPSCSSSTSAITWIRSEPPDLVIFCACEGDGLHGELLKRLRAQLAPQTRMIWVGCSRPSEEVARLVDATVLFDQDPDRLFELLQQPEREGQEVQGELPPAELLTGRELNVLEAMSRGVTSNRDLAEALGISQNTVKFHVRNVLAKLDLHKRAELVAFALSRPGELWQGRRRPLRRAG